LTEDLIRSISWKLLSKDLIAFSGVCSNWREIVLQNHEKLSSASFSLDSKKPFSNEETFQAKHCDVLPSVFTKVG